LFVLFFLEGEEIQNKDHGMETNDERWERDKDCGMSFELLYK
jgi:hypothetical protein